MCSYRVFREWKSKKMWVNRHERIQGKNFYPKKVIFLENKWYIMYPIHEVLVAGNSTSMVANRTVYKSDIRKGF